MDKTIKVTIDNIEMKVTVSEEELAKLIKKQKKKTGYERVAKYQQYFVVCGTGETDSLTEAADGCDNEHYETANYYNDETVANNNARADKLMRQLKRFAAENCEEVEWNNRSMDKYYIYYDYNCEKLYIHNYRDVRDFGQIYFDTEENTEKAIEIFKDELLWYFREYKDRL